jgi:hypothetical protein
VALKGAVPTSPADALAPEWRVLQAQRLNTLLTGPGDMIEAALQLLWPNLEPPVYQWECGAELAAPVGARTVLIRDVDTLSPDQQQITLAWLDGTDARQHIQVVSIASVDPYPLVERGMFLKRLYYRLNVLRLDGSTLIGSASVS